MPFATYSIAAGWRAPLFVCLAATILGLGVVVAPLPTVGLAAVSLLALAVLVLVPRGDLLLFLAFLLCQDTMRLLAGWSTSAATVIKRLDEPLLLVLGLASLLVPDVRRALAHRGLVLAIAACYAGILLSSVGGTASMRAMAIDLMLFSKPFLLLVLGTRVVCDEVSIRRFVPQVAVVAAAILVASAVIYLFPGLEMSYVGAVKDAETRMGMTVARGVFADTGTFSWFAVAVASGAYAAWLAFADRRYLLLATLAALMLLLTWRRKSIVALAVVLAVSVVAHRLRRGRWRPIVVLVVVGLAVATVLAPHMRSMADLTVREYGGADPYRTARTALYYAAGQIARDHFPLGTGLGSFGSYASAIEYSSVYHEYGLAGIWGLAPWGDDFVTDTFWPMVLGQGGVVALAGYLMFLALLGSTALRAAWSPGSAPELRVLALAALFLVVGSFVESIASHIYGASLQAALVFLPVGMLWRARSRLTEVGSRTTS